MYKYIFVLVINLGIVSTLLSQISPHKPHPIFGEGVLNVSTEIPDRTWGANEVPEIKEAKEVKRLSVSNLFFLQKRPPLKLPNLKTLEIWRTPSSGSWHGAYISNIEDLKGVHKRIQESDKVYYWENFLSWDNVITLNIKVLEANIDAKSLNQIIEKCTNLERLIIDGLVYEDDSLFTFKKKNKLKYLELFNLYSIHSFDSPNIPKWIFRFEAIDTLWLNFRFLKKIPERIYELHHVKNLFLNSEYEVGEAITKLASLEGICANFPDTLYYFPRLKFLYNVPYNINDPIYINLKYLYKFPNIEKISLANVIYERDKAIFRCMPNLRDLTLSIDSLGEDIKYLTKLTNLDCELTYCGSYINTLHIAECKDLKKIRININPKWNKELNIKEEAYRKGILVKFPENIDNCTNLQEVRINTFESKINKDNFKCEIYFPASFKSNAQQLTVFKTCINSNIDPFYQYMSALKTLEIATHDFEFSSFPRKVTRNKGINKIPNGLSQMTELDSLILNYPIKKWNKTKGKNPSLHCLCVACSDRDLQWIINNRRYIFPKLEVIWGTIQVEIIDFEAKL